MKLTAILTAQAAVSAQDERWFSDIYTVSPSVDVWWHNSPNVPANQMKKLRSTTGKFFYSYFPGKQRQDLRTRFGDKWAKLQDDMESAAEDCTFVYKGANGNRERSRRSNGQDERFMNAFTQGDSNAKLDFWAFAEGHARWIVKEIQKTCPVKAQRLLRRVDRFRWTMSWRYCKNYDQENDLPVTSKATQDEDPVGFCWWAYFNWRTGATKGHPRKSNENISEPGGIFSIDGPQ